MSCAVFPWSYFCWGSPPERCQCKTRQGKFQGQADVQTPFSKHVMLCSVARWLGAILSRKVVLQQSAMPIQDICVPLKLLAAQEYTQHEYMCAHIVVCCVMIDAPSVTSQIVNSGNATVRHMQLLHALLQWRETSHATHGSEDHNRPRRISAHTAKPARSCSVEHSS
jgi:hypothetical protein